MGNTPQNISYYTSDLNAEIENDIAYSSGKTSEPMFCMFENGDIYDEGLRLVMLNGDPLLRRVSVIIDRLVEAGFYNTWVSRFKHLYKFRKHIQRSVHKLDGYYSFNLHHMRPAFYLLLMGLCLSSLCFIFELLYNRLLSKRN